MFVNLTTETFVGNVFTAAAGTFSGFRVVNRSISAQSFVNEFVRLVDTVGDFGDDNFFAVETSHCDIFVRRDDNAVRLSDFFSG